MKKNCLLKQAEEQERVANEFGFYWTQIEQLIDQIRSECAEVQEAWNKGDRIHLQEEIGDLLLASISLAVFCRLDPHDTLLQSIEKFQGRYDKVVALAHREGHANLRHASFEELMRYWERAKENK